MGSGDLGLFPLTMWPSIALLATVWASWLLMGYPNGGCCHLPTHPPHPTAYPIRQSQIKMSSIELVHPVEACASLFQVFLKFMQ